MLKLLLKVILLITLTFTFAVSNAEETDALATAKSLIAEGKYTDAYDLLEPLESERSGNVDFDYQFGVAAVESGKTTRGIFALERVLAVDPNNTAARSEIAKAYFRSGEADTAKAEFQNVLEQHPSKEMSAAIENYMSAIDKSLGLTSTFAAYVDLGLGYDSNISSATSAVSVSANGIAPGAQFTLLGAARERSSNFMAPSAGISFRDPFGKNLSVFGSVNTVNTFNWASDTFDVNALDFNLGVSYKKNIDTFTAALQGSTYDIGSRSFLNTYGASGQWQRDIDDRNQVSIYGQASNMHYPGEDIRDVDRYVIGAGWGHAFSGDKAPVIFLSAYGGEENSTKSGFDFLGDKLYGVRAGGQMVLNYKLVAYAASGYEHRHYDDTDPAFLIRREDNQYNFTVGMRYLPIAKWTIRPQVSYLKNDSDNALYEYDRTIVSVNFRHDFDW